MSAPHETGFRFEDRSGNETRFPWRSWVDGFRRVWSAPAVLLGVFACTFLMAVPMALVVRASLRAHLGNSLEAAGAADGVNYDWWEEFTAQASGLGATFSPSILGFAPVLDNVSGVLDGQSEILPVTGLLGGYLLLWTFLSGGIVDRLARQRPTRPYGFFMASGTFFFRFLRLAVIAGLIYWLMYRYLHHWLFDEWLLRVTRPLDTERTAFVWRMGMYAIFGAALVLVNVIFDYSRIRAVVEDRRSMVGAMLASLRFIWRHPRQVVGLYFLNSIAFVTLVLVWAFAAPGAGGPGVSMWLVFLVSQIYLLARLFLKLQFIASQTALFQRSLAHARYTALPAAAVPVSPAAEALSTSLA